MGLYGSNLLRFSIVTMIVRLTVSNTSVGVVFSYLKYLITAPFNLLSTEFHMETDIDKAFQFCFLMR